MAYPTRWNYSIANKQKRNISGSAVSVAGDGTAGSLGPIGSAGTVGRVADTQMGEADAEFRFVNGRCLF